MWSKNPTRLDVSLRNLTQTLFETIINLCRIFPENFADFHFSKSQDFLQKHRDNNSEPGHCEEEEGVAEGEGASGPTGYRYT